MSSRRVQKVGHGVQTGSDEKQWQKFRTTPEEDLVLALLFSSNFSVFPSVAKQKQNEKEEKEKEREKRKRTQEKVE